VDEQSPVPVRLLARREVKWGAPALADRLRSALAWRDRVVEEGTTGYRLVHGEGDALPGLIVDRFGDALAIQANMRNYLPLLPVILETLQIWGEGRLAPHKVVVESGAGREVYGGASAKMQAQYRLNGIDFQTDLEGGPKTGAFLDQRENYARLESWLGRLGITGAGLDLYSSSGGFALHMARAGLRATAVDSSGPAVARIERNARLNEAGGVTAIREDVMQYLRSLSQTRRSFDCVVVDPPAFAKQMKDKRGARKAYWEVNRRALGFLKPGGILVTCSCSAALSGEEFREIIRSVAAEMRKGLTLLEERSQAIDHRILLEIPESKYLKTFLYQLRAG
jgi:23S rRNA (cytosine1962-C5)-methyltransferase